MKRLAVLAFALLSVSEVALAQPLLLAQATADPGAAPQAVKKPAKAKPKAASGAASANPSAARNDAGYVKTLQEPRRIRREDLEDDPSAPAASRFTPSLTPEGRPAMGARF